MIKLYNRVVVLKHISNTAIKSGDVGTVVMIHPKKIAYEVEFFALDGSTIDVITVDAKNVRAVTKNEITHVRSLAFVS